MKVINDADWNLEIGALTETVSELIDEPPALMFDEIKGYPKGFRVLSIPTASRVRMAIALGLPPDTPKMEIVRHAAQRIKHAPPIPPQGGRDRAGDAERHARQRGRSAQFPVLQSHAGDGGRYIGTGDSFINRDPETGYVNMGTYRMQVHERNLLGIWQSPGQQGRLIAERYWKQGKACPVVATFGGDPLLFFLSYTKFPFGVSELDRAGGMLGPPGRGDQGAAHRPADPGACRGRDRRRDAAARGRVAAGRSVRRMAGLLHGRHQGHRRRAAGRSASRRSTIATIRSC